MELEVFSIFVNVNMCFFPINIFSLLDNGVVCCEAFNKELSEHEVGGVAGILYGVLVNEGG